MMAHKSSQSRILEVQYKTMTILGHSYINKINYEGEGIRNWNAGSVVAINRTCFRVDIKFRWMHAVYIASLNISTLQPSHSWRQKWKQCSPFWTAREKKESFNMVEHLTSSLLIMSAQCIMWNRNLPYFSLVLHKDRFALSSLWIQGSKIGKRKVHDFFSFNIWIFNNST